jgi:hypothetical protein
VCSGDSRVVVVASLRRLLPPLVPSYFRSEELSGLLADDILGRLPLASLLADQPPVPQYAARLLTEVMAASPRGAVLVALLVCGDQQHQQQAGGEGGPAGSRHVLQTLLFSALAGSEQASPSSSSSTPPPRGGGGGGSYSHYEGDAHVAHLLARILHVSMSPPSGSGSGPSPRSLLLLFPAGLASTLLTVTASACARRDLALLGPVLELLGESLEVLKQQQREEEGEEGGQQGEDSRSVQVAVHLSSVLPRVLSALVWSQHDGGATATAAATATATAVQQHCLRVFSLLLDLVPRHMTSLLCRDSEEDESFGSVCVAVLSAAVVSLRFLPFSLKLGFFPCSVD